tara:strand:- start:568 stop:717 length:150 start_codon:yes stop_codon:yes gene_type:complete
MRVGSRTFEARTAGHRVPDLLPTCVDVFDDAFEPLEDTVALRTPRDGVE